MKNLPYEKKLYFLQNTVEDLHEKSDAMTGFILNIISGNATNPSPDNVGSSEKNAVEGIFKKSRNATDPSTDELGSSNKKTNAVQGNLQKSRYVTNPSIDDLGSSKKSNEVEGTLQISRNATNASTGDVASIKKNAVKDVVWVDNVREVALPDVVRIGPTGEMRCSIQDETPIKRKRRKCEVYDTHRELDPDLLVVFNWILDPDLLDSYEKWMDGADERTVLLLVDSFTDVKDLKSLADKGLVCSNVMASALCLHRKRMNFWPELIEEGSRVLDPYFINLVTSWQSGKKNSVKALKKYVDGSIPTDGNPWAGCRVLYAPVCHDNHWFSLRIHLEDRKIYLYDCAPKPIERRPLESLLEPLQIGIPRILKELVVGFESYSLEMFSYEKVKPLEVESTGYDCGIFALKWIEFLTMRRDVLSVTQDYIPLWRKKLAVELWHSRLAPL